MKVHPNIAVSESGYLFNPSNGDSFSLNPTATDIILLLKEDKSREEIRLFLLDKYEIDPVLLERDLDEFLMEIKAYYLVSGE
jgi:hypothetical protein